MATAQSAKRKSKEYGRVETLREGVLKYKGIEVGIFEEEPTDKTPARLEKDARNGKDFIYMVDTVPKRLYVPLLEHELYELKHGREGRKEADELAEKTAKDLWVLEEFKEFRTYWEKRKKKIRTRKVIRWNARKKKT